MAEAPALVGLVSEYHRIDESANCRKKCNSWRKRETDKTEGTTEWDSMIR